MNLSEVGNVLAKAALFDHRTVDEFVVTAWHEAIGDLDYGDAMAAVTRWYRDRADRLMPSHLREAVALVRADRRRATRLAEAENTAANGPERAPAVRFADLPPETRAALRVNGRGPLNPILQHLIDERFDPQPSRELNPPSVLDGMYGDPRQDSEGD